MSDATGSDVTVENQEASAVAAADPLRPLTQPWVTRVTVAICIAIFAGLTLKNDSQNPQTLAQFGYLMADAVWNGAWWSLVTSPFVHIEIWHLAFNLCWLWALGMRMEGEIGSLPYLAFILVAAFVSSAFQLAVSDTTGIGMSGVVYAIFGFMWLTRSKYPRFAEVLNTQNIKLFLGWLVVCVVITQLKLLNVGNAAHFTGLLFGMAIAAVFAPHYRPILTIPAAIALIGLSVVPLVWCPWSPTWLSLQAYNAHLAKNYDEALVWYTRLINLDPRNAWAFANRGGVNASLGRIKDAMSDFATARRLDPKFADLPTP